MLLYINYNKIEMLKNTPIIINYYAIKCEQIVNTGKNPDFADNLHSIYSLYEVFSQRI